MKKDTTNRLVTVLDKQRFLKNVEKGEIMDLRTERTKRNIINAFIELRAKKPLEKITVKELSELAYINKATFYSHYHDIYDLSEQLEDEAIANVLKNIPHPDSIVNNPKLCIEELTSALQSQDCLTNILFSGTRSSILASRLEQGIKQEVFARHPEYQDNLKWNILLTYLIQGGFRASVSYMDVDNDVVTEILGDVNEYLVHQFLSPDVSKK